MGWFRNRHRHAYRIAGVYHEWFNRGHDRTTVLYRCECGVTVTRDFEGIWTKEQLLGRAA